MRFFKEKDKREKRNQDTPAFIGMIIAGFIGVGNFIFGIYCIWHYLNSLASGMAGFLIYIGINFGLLFLSVWLTEMSNYHKE